MTTSIINKTRILETLPFSFLMKVIENIRTLIMTF